VQGLSRCASSAAEVAAGTRGRCVRAASVVEAAPTTEPPSVRVSQSGVPGSQWGVAMTSEQGLRDGMEDSATLHFDEDSGVLFCGVYDGHGGDQAATWLARELHPLLLSALKAKSPKSQSELFDTVSVAFESADKLLMAELERQGREVLEDAGATATVAMIGRGGQIMVANIGDSQCFLLRNKMEKELTTPHRVYGGGKHAKSEIARVQGTGAWIFDGRVCNMLAVSRAFGDWEMKPEGLHTLLQSGIDRGLWSEKFAAMKNVTEAPVTVEPAVSETLLSEADELMVLATDGLWDVMPPHDAMLIAQHKLRRGASPQEVADSLVRAALKRKSTDNVTVTVIDFKGAEYWAAAGAPPKSWLGQKMEVVFGRS